MYFSGEARWFFRGTAGESASAWIATSPFATQQAERVDQYLVLPTCANTGIKLRDGNFEVKVQASPTEHCTWSEQVAGGRDTWLKWSCPMSGQYACERPTAPWIGVTKRRDVRLYSLESDAPVEVAADGPWLSAGCMVEVADIRAHGEAWWSVCFEAFGNPDELLQHLDRTIAHFAGEAPGVELPQDASKSYPAWLGSLV